MPVSISSLPFQEDFHVVNDGRHDRHGMSLLYLLDFEGLQWTCLWILLG